VLTVKRAVCKPETSTYLQEIQASDHISQIAIHATPAPREVADACRSIHELKSFFSFHERGYLAEIALVYKRYASALRVTVALTLTEERKARIAIKFLHYYASITRHLRLALTKQKVKRIVRTSDLSIACLTGVLSQRIAFCVLRAWSRYPKVLKPTRDEVLITFPLQDGQTESEQMPTDKREYVRYHTWQPQLEGMQISVLALC
jgi:hypothetical protein